MEKNNINRRDFLKIAGAGAATMGVAAACGPKNISKAVSGSSEEGPEEMVYRTNPKTGDKVSLIGYGCMRWQMKDDGTGKQVIDQDIVNELVDYAIAHGVNYFDSAPVYLQGQSERAAGIALKRYPRDSYYIATKMSNFNMTDFDSCVKMYKDSLGYYETDYVDYYLLHSLSGGAAFKTRFLDNGLLDYLLKERELGHIRNLGFSFHGSKEGFDEMMAYHDQYHWDFVQIQMNYADWKQSKEANAEYLYEELQKRGIPVVIMEPLLGGQLSKVPGAVAEHLKSREPEKSIASWAFRFVGSYPGVLVTLSGMTYMEHLVDNVSTFTHFKPLSEEENEFLLSMGNLIKSYPLIGCTACQYCMPCPYGIDIPSIFRHYNDSLNAGNVADSKDQENYRKLKKAYLTSYDKAIESVRQADHCIGCNTCVSRCPQRIRIPSELQRIDRYVESLKQNTL